MRKIQILSSIKVLINELHFKSSQMEKSYGNFQRDLEQSLLNFMNIFFLALTFADVTTRLFNSRFDMMIVRVINFALSLLAFLCRNKLNILQRLGLIFACGGSVLTIVGTTEPSIVTIMGAKGTFLIGNMLGLIEMAVTLAFKSIMLRTLSYMIMLIIKIVGLSEQLWSSVWYNSFVFSTTIMIIVFCTYKDILSRRGFRIMYESRTKLEKFEDLLSNGLPANVVIVSSQFDSIFYSNSLFKEKFMERNQPENDLARIFERFIIQPDDTNQERNQNLSEFLQKVIKKEFSIHENDFFTALTIYKDDCATDIYYEIKIRKLIWDEKPSYAIIINDVSDKQMVIGLKMADEQKDKVIATISHELRTPINGILGLLEMLSLRIQDDEQSFTYLDHCKSCSKLLLYLVNSILDLSQIRNNCLTVNKEWVNLNILLEEVKSLYIYHSQQKNIKFMIEKGTDIPTQIFTDKYRLIQILVNLLGNAMKFTFKGSVLLKVTNCPQENNHKLIFCVEDTGIGIQKEDQSKLFKMYGKIKQITKNINLNGVGLGLTISNELVKYLNISSSKEKIEVESEYGKGSKFWFRIDILSSQLEQSQSSNQTFLADESSSLEMDEKEDLYCQVDMKIKKYDFHLSNIDTKKQPDFSNRLTSQDQELLTSPSTAKTQKKLVLLVDDNPFNLMAAAFVMKKLGYESHQAFNGREGVEKLEQSVDSGIKYSLILTDIQMPVLDGIEMSKEISSKIRNKEIYHIPIMAITAQDVSEEEKAKYRTYGISCVMHKPLIPEVLEKHIADLDN